MATTDKRGNAVGLGDVLIVTVESIGTKVVTIVRISESLKGVSATGAYVDLDGGVRTKKVAVNVSNARLLVKADGSEVAS